MWKAFYVQRRENSTSPKGDEQILRVQRDGLLFLGEEPDEKQRSSEAPCVVHRNRQPEARVEAVGRRLLKASNRNGV